MKITILTMFPESFSSLSTFPVIKRAVDRGLLELVIKDIKNYGGGSFRHIDDSSGNDPSYRYSDESPL